MFKKKRRKKKKVDILSIITSAPEPKNLEG